MFVFKLDLVGKVSNLSILFAHQNLRNPLKESDSKEKKRLTVDFFEGKKNYIPFILVPKDLFSVPLNMTRLRISFFGLPIEFLVVV